MNNFKRFDYKPFAEDANNNGQFGSFMEGNPVTTNDINAIQSLPAYKQGWNMGALGQLLVPTLEEMQGIQYAQTYGISYLMQKGIPEWSAGTTYYTNSIVMKDGLLWRSLEDNNIGRPPLIGKSKIQTYSLPTSNSTTAGKTSNGVYFYANSNPNDNGGFYWSTNPWGGTWDAGGYNYQRDYVSSMRAFGSSASKYVYLAAVKLSGGSDKHDGTFFILDSTDRSVVVRSAKTGGFTGEVFAVTGTLSGASNWLMAATYGVNDTVLFYTKDSTTINGRTFSIPFITGCMCASPDFLIVSSRDSSTIQRFSVTDSAITNLGSVTIPELGGGQFRQIILDTNRFIGITTNGRILTSNNGGQTWTLAATVSAGTSLSYIFWDAINNLWRVAQNDANMWTVSPDFLTITPYNVPTGLKANISYGEIISATEQRYIDHAGNAIDYDIGIFDEVWEACIVGENVIFEDEQTFTIGSLLIVKKGRLVAGGAAQNITFDEAFPNGLLGAFVSQSAAGNAYASSLTLGGLQISGMITGANVYWTAWGY